MNRRFVVTTAVVAALALPGTALAQKGGKGSGWTYGGTVGQGQQAIGFYGGFPGVGGAYMRGMNSTTDMGGVFTFGYSLGGNFTFLLPGLVFQFLTKLALSQTGTMNLVLHLTPGLAFYFGGNAALVGLVLPAEFLVGMPLQSDLMLYFGGQLAINLFFTPTVLFGLTILPTAGMEYRLNRQLSLGGQLRLGPAIYSVSGVGGFGGGTAVGFAMHFLFTLTYFM